MKNVVVFDASFLLPVFSQNLSAMPKDPSTGKPVERYDEKVDYLLSQLEEAETQMLIPTPALSEILVEAGTKRVAEYVKEIFSKSTFLVASFEMDAAIEVAIMSRNAQERDDKRSGSTEAWQKVKLDRQIVAIAKVNNARVIYSDDKNLRNFAEQAGLEVVSSYELQFPPQLAP